LSIAPLAGAFNMMNDSVAEILLRHGASEPALNRATILSGISG
jgi:hypothetical protein